MTKLSPSYKNLSDKIVLYLVPAKATDYLVLNFGQTKLRNSKIPATANIVNHQMLCNF